MLNTYIRCLLLVATLSTTKEKTIQQNKSTIIIESGGFVLSQKNDKESLFTLKSGGFVTKIRFHQLISYPNNGNNEG